MKARYVILLTLAVLLAACSSDKPDNLVPMVRTQEPATVTRTSATLQGTVTLSGTATMPQLAFVYGKAGGQTQQTVAAMVTDGHIAAAIDGLTAGTYYQYELQATNGHALLHGGMVTFTTMPNDLPTVSPASVLSSGPVSAIVGFDIPDDGGETLTATGCYLMEGTQTVLDVSKARQFAAERTDADTLAYRSVVSGLTMNATYTCFPYAVTRVGERRGQGVTLTTKEALQLSTPGDFAKMMGGGVGAWASLTIAGPMNGDDIRCLRGLDLTEINLADAQIVTGGEPYAEGYYTEDDIVGQGMFGGCDKLTTIVLPDKATEIAKDAFKDCASLQSLTIPAAASKVVPSTGCTALKEIKVSAANTRFKSEDGVLTNAAVTDIEWFPMGKTGSYTLPSTITAIGDYAFRGCNITDFVLPADLTTLGQGVFAESGVESVTLPDRLRTIPSSTFQGCSRLHTVRLGAATDYVSDYVFSGCSLTDLYIAAQLPPVCGSRAFATSGTDFTKTCRLHVPKGRSRYYQNSNAWKVFAHIVED